MRPIIVNVAHRAALICCTFVISQMALENMLAPPLAVIDCNSWNKNWRWFSRLLKWGTGLLCSFHCLSQWCHQVVGKQSVKMWALSNTFLYDLYLVLPSCSLQDNSKQLLPLSLPLVYCRGLLLSMLLKLWLRRLRLDDPGLLEAPLPAAGTREGPGNLEEWHDLDFKS